MKRLVYIESPGPARDALERRLLDLGAEVCTADDLAAGRASARRDRPELVVVGLLLPDCGGLAACRALREDPVLVDLPLALVAASPAAARANAVEARRAGAAILTAASDESRWRELLEDGVTGEPPGEEQASGDTWDGLPTGLVSDVLEATTDLVAVMRDDRLAFLNRAGQRMLGLDGLPPEGPERDALREALFPGLEGPGETVEGLPAGVRVWHRQCELPGEGDRRIPTSQVLVAHDSASGERRFLSLMARDISEHVRLQTELERERERYASFVEHSGEGIYLFEFDEAPHVEDDVEDQIQACYDHGYTAACNDVFARMYGHRKASEVLGRRLIEVHGTDQNPENRAFIAEFIRNGYRIRDAVSEEFGRDGETLHFTNNIIGIVEKGRLVRIWGSQQDVTDRIRAEAALQRAHDELEERVRERTSELIRAKDRAVQADEAKSAFLAAISHELRTPLSSIIGFTKLVLQGVGGELNESQTEQLSIVDRNAQHLLLLIDDLLDISRIEADQIELRSERVDLGAVVSAVLESLGAQAAGKGLAMESRLSEEARFVIADETRLEQVLLNLIGNAVKFTDEGRVRVEAVAERGSVVVRVSDTGPGIPEEKQELIFDPFRQADDQSSRRHAGTGLGLAISQRLIGLMGGRISVESTLGRGSTFEFALKRARARAES